jgi:GntR family transcriptional repressor for pyruvate dehydrogenase complex
MNDVTDTLPHGAIPQQVAQMLQKMIADGKFKPGDPLPSQRDLAAQFKVSRTALREALSVLATLGLIHIQPGKGVYVRGVNPANGAARAKEGLPRAAAAEETYQLRYALEPFAIGLTAPKISQETLEGLRINVTAMRTALEANNLVEAAYLDFEFHRLLMDASGNKAFRDVVSHYKSTLMESQRLPFSRHDKTLETAGEHAAIVQALEHRSSAEAMAAMQAHIRNAAARAGVHFPIPDRPGQ